MFHHAKPANCIDDTQVLLNAVFRCFLLIRLFLSNFYTAETSWMGVSLSATLTTFFVSVKIVYSVHVNSYA